MACHVRRADVPLGFAKPLAVKVGETSYRIAFFRAASQVGTCWPSCVQISFLPSFALNITLWEVECYVEWEVSEDASRKFLTLTVRIHL